MCTLGLIVYLERILGLMHILILHSCDLPCSHLISIPTHNHKEMERTSEIPQTIVRSKYHRNTNKAC